MKKVVILSLILVALGITDSLAEEFRVITAEEVMDLDTVADKYVVSPAKIAKAQHGMNSHLQRMYDTYSLPELARHALHLNQAQIRAAKRRGTEVPKPLTREILSDRDKIIEYLKSEYEFKY